MWSKRNIEYVTRLEVSGHMMPAGLAEVRRAKEDGRWDAAYDRLSEMVIPEYFIEALSKKPKVKEFFESLNKSNKYAIACRLQTARTDETRNRRMEKIINTLENGQKLH